MEKSEDNRIKIKENRCKSQGGTLAVPKTASCSKSAGVPFAAISGESGMDGMDRMDVPE
jgi:hypothetical protein